MNTDTNPLSNSFVQLSDSRMIRYDEFVRKLFKLNAACGDSVHAAMGIAGEAGELTDAIKKHIVYNKPLDLVNVIEELGDLRFYMQALMNLYGITEQQVLQYNAAKLMVRYEGLEYSDRAAQERKDKIGEGTVKLSAEQQAAVDETGQIKNELNPGNEGTAK